MVDHSPRCWRTFDSQLICRYGNASYRCVFESPGHTLEGMPFEALVQPDKRDIILPRAHAALAGTPQEYEYERTTASGSRIHVEVKYTPDLRDNTVVGMFVELHQTSPAGERIEELVLETDRDLEEREQERNARALKADDGSG